MAPSEIKKGQIGLTFGSGFNRHAIGSPIRAAGPVTDGSQGRRHDCQNCISMQTMTKIDRNK